MHEAPPSMSDRIDRLEPRLRRFTVGRSIPPTPPLLIGAAVHGVIRPKSVTTEQLVIVYADGRARAAICCGEQQDPVLEFSHPDHPLILDPGNSRGNKVKFIQFRNTSGRFERGVTGNASSEMESGSSFERAHQE